MSESRPWSSLKTKGAERKLGIPVIAIGRPLDSSGNILLGKVITSTSLTPDR